MKYRVFWNDKMWYADDFKNPLHQFMVDMNGTLWAWSPVCLPSAMDDAILMYWTGLQDCNDKDIYDGDIIEFEEYCTVNRWVVEWEWLSAQWDTGCTKCSEWKTIIGNIHENSDLVEIP